MASDSRPSLARTSDRSLARGVFLILLALYTATFTGVPENADAEVEYQTTSSLARRGRLDLGGTPEADALIAASPPGREGQGFGVAPGGPGREGRYYSWFGVGQAFAALPLWALGHGLALAFPAIERRHTETTYFGAARSELFEHLAVGWRNSLLTALTAWLLMISARRVGASARSAFVAALAYGVATFAWPQARSTLSDVQATFCLFLAFHLLLFARERRELASRSAHAALAGAALALGFAFLTRVAVAPAVAWLGLCAASGVWLASRSAPAAPEGKAGARLLLSGWAALLVPFLACVAVFIGTNFVRFGRALETGYGAAMTGGSFFSSPPHLGLAGLLLSPGKGLLWMAPGILLAILGAVKACSSGRKALVACTAGVALLVLAPACFMQGWHGAWTYGPRYLLPLLPFAWLFVALGLDEVRGAPARVAAMALLGSGLLTSLSAVLVDYTTHLGLAQPAARIAWPAVAGDSDFQRDDDRFLRLQWDWRFAAPWAHWRILRHRAAGGGEAFPVREIFFLDDPTVLAPRTEREQGMNHWAWVDLRERLGAPVWPAAALCAVLLALGLRAARRGLAAGG